MLVHSEPRGLPGTTIDRVELQRADDGFPLDDVIIHAHENTTGRFATLQIQVKRSIAFSSGRRGLQEGHRPDRGGNSKNPNFWTERNELAIATARSSERSMARTRMCSGGRGSSARLRLSLTVWTGRGRPTTTCGPSLRLFVIILRDAGAPAQRRNSLEGARAPSDTGFRLHGGRLRQQKSSRASGLSACCRRKMRQTRASLWSALTDLSEEIAAGTAEIATTHASLLISSASRSVSARDRHLIECASLLSPKPLRKRLPTWMTASAQRPSPEPSGSKR